MDFRSFKEKKKTKKSDRAFSTHPSTSNAGKNESMQPDTNQIKERNEVESEEEDSCNYKLL